MANGYAEDYVVEQIGVVSAQEKAKLESKEFQAKMTTKASIGHATGRVKRQTPSKPQIVLKQFQNIPAKLVMPTGNTPRPARVRAVTAPNFQRKVPQGL